MNSMKDLFDKVMNNKQEPESNNDDNQESESKNDDNQGPEFNQDYFENDQCPYCGFPDYFSKKREFPHGIKVIEFKCCDCTDGWMIVRNADGEILMCIYGDEYRSRFGQD